MRGLATCRRKPDGVSNGQKYSDQADPRYIMTVMGLAQQLAAQARKPSGWFGRLVMSRFFNTANRRINDLAIERLEIQPTDRVLDIGFGGGYTLPIMAALARDGKVHGVDFSESMVQLAEKRCADLIQQGRIELRVSDLGSLPYADGTFDKVSTVNTLYFWPSPLANVREMRRVIKPGGRLVVAFRSRESLERAAKKLLYGFTLYDPEAVASLLERAGFTNVQIEKYPHDKPMDSNLAVGTA
jgi:SAM-dependent methyltransferase